MAQRLSEQVVEWLTVGGDAFTPQTNVPLVVSQPGKTVTVPTTAGTSLGAYINQAQLWVLGAAAASTNVKSSQIVVSSSDAGSGGAVALELWRGTAASFQFVNDDGIFYIKNNYASSAATTYANNNLAMRYGAVADQYVHIYSTKDSSYAYSVGGAALSVAGGATFAKKIYINDTADSNYSTVAGSFVTKGGAYIAKKTYIADTTDSSSTSTGALVVSGGVGIAKKLYVGSDFNQTGDNAIIKSNVIRIQNKSANTSQAGTSSPYVTSLHIGDGREVTLDEYQDGALAIHSNKGLFLHTTSTPIAVYDATKTYSVGAIVFYNCQYYRCTTAITEAQEWTAANWTSIGTSSGILKTDATSVVPVVTNTSSLGTSSLRWKSLEIGTASSYGSGTQPIYWNAGVPTASTSTVGSGVKPIYLSSGTLTVSSSTIGSGVKPVYLNSGEITVSSSTVGSGVIPMYLSGGTLTASTSTVGSGTKPIYLSSGTITVSSSTAGGTAQPVYLSSGEFKAISATVGSGVKPVYLSSGTITVSSSTVGGTAQPVYLSSGEIKVISATVGTATKPVYLSSGTITVGTYELKATVNYEVNAKINSGTATRFAYYSGANAISSYLRIGTIGSARYPLDFTLHNDAGTKVAEFWYDQGTTTNVTSGSWRFRAWSPKSTADTGVTSYYEDYYLPTVTTGRTSNAGYNVLTTKDLSFSITGSAQKVGIAGIWLYPNNNNEINFGGTNTSDTIYFGYRATDSRPKPATFVFGSGSGTATIKAAVLVTTNHGTGNPGSSTPGNGITGAVYFKRV